MPFGRSLLQRESLLRVSGEERSPEILISFHSSGSTSNQWRKLKKRFPGRTPFRPSCCETGKRSGFSHSLLIVQVPLVYCIWPKKHRTGWSSYLLGTPWTKICFHYMGNIDLLTLVDHMDVEKASDFDELETSLFHFYLPSSYLCFVCSREEFDLFNLGIPPK
nr:ribosomal protein L10 [Styphnolobium japonicum]